MKIGNQSASKGCDILATDLNKQLVVVELKNTEDRYIVQQLTRYDDSLQTNQPFREQVNYSLPIRLLVIAPAAESKPNRTVDKQAQAYQAWSKAPQTADMYLIAQGLGAPQIQERIAAINQQLQQQAQSAKGQQQGDHSTGLSM